ncbi:hypothetical protein B7994_11280 [Fibrobacter sp. UWR2]|nr:hypothetical protein B7994_11280 [Fibrobacter sp. UWR2]
MDRNMDKNELIKLINKKGLHNSLITIYYDIGRVLPFRAQRYPDGRISDWYKSQYVEVHEVKPGGKGGKYGHAYGFYYRNGERADEMENNPEQSWCRKNDTTPQCIPCAACGSWVLLDILNDPAAEPAKLIGINDVIEMGEYKGRTLAEVVHTDWQWIQWAIKNIAYYFAFFDTDALIKERSKSLESLHIEGKHPDDILTFGKHKGKTIRYVAENDMDYLKWATLNIRDFVFNFNEL